MQALSKSLWVDTDINMTALVHELQVRGALHPWGVACERQVQLQRDSYRVFWETDISNWLHTQITGAEALIWILGDWLTSGHLRA